MIAERFITVSLSIVTALMLEGSWNWRSSLPDWFGIFRTVMMVFGGLVVIVIVLVVTIAIISGVLGMVGNLRKPRE